MSAKNIMNNTRRFFAVPLIMTLVMGLFYYPGLVARVEAGSLTALSDTMSRQKASELSSHTIRFTTPTAIATTGHTIIVTFPSDFSFASKTIGTVTFTHGATTGAESTETLAASASATAWGAAFSGTANRIFTLTAPTDGIGAGTLAANDKVIITYDSTNSTNATSTGSKTITVVTTADSGSIAVPIVAGSAADEQVVVTATVDPTITFTNDDAAIGFGTLTTSNARYANAAGTGSGSEATAHTLAVATNATSGYTLTYTGATLTSGANTIAPATISADADGTPGSAQFAISADLTGSGTVTSSYDNATPNYNFVAGTTTTIASHTGPTSSESIGMRYLANIAAATPAGTYTTTITYLATGNF